MGKFIFTIPAKPFMGKILCAFRDSCGNLFFPTPGFAGRGENSNPYFSSLWDFHSHLERENFNNKFNALIPHFIQNELNLMNMDKINLITSSVVITHYVICFKHSYLFNSLKATKITLDIALVYIIRRP